MNRLCDACNAEPVLVHMGTAGLCRRCAVDVEAEIDRRRAEGGSRGRNLTALTIAREMLRERVGTRDIILRDLPANMVDEMAQHGSIRDVAITAIAQWLAKNHKARE